ncbi:MAG: cytochrome c biogenesis CcdA family protein [Candidatus Rokuibacteriota bacterium]
MSFVAGALTVLSPCVLPLVPLAVTSALQHHPFGPVALVMGLAAASWTVGLLFATLGLAIDRDVVRLAAAALLVVFGAALLSKRPETGLAHVTSPLAGRAAGWLARIAPAGWHGQLVVGLLLGAMWIPCAGPTLGAAITLAATGTNLAGVATVMAAFSLGITVPLLALAYGSRGVFGRRARDVARIARPVTAAALVAVGLLTLSGSDRALETRLVAAMPAWLVDLVTLF